MTLRHEKLWTFRKQEETTNTDQCWYSTDGKKKSPGIEDKRTVPQDDGPALWNDDERQHYKI